MKADKIKYILSQMVGNKKAIFLTEVKTGSTWFNDNLHKFDALSIQRSWSRPCISGYEIKTSRQDFLNDDKWPNYLEFCHRFYFVCPHNLIKANEISDHVGLIWVNDNGGFKTMKKALYRNIEPPASMFYHLIISHMQSDRHPFFNSEREYLEAWLADKENRKELSVKMTRKVFIKFHELQKEVEELKGELEGLRRTTSNYSNLQKILKANGLNIWNIEEELPERLKSSLSPELKKHLANLSQILKEMKID